MDGEAPDIKRWFVLYPVYINSKKTVAEGRRIGLSKACENPTCAEISDCCSHLKLPFAIEINKAYPRDFLQRGRVRVSLKREDGALYNSAISSRKQLMLHVAELVPRHPGRTKKQEAATTSGAGPSKPGKGGKKKRFRKVQGLRSGITALWAGNWEVIIVVQLIGICTVDLTSSQRNRVRVVSVCLSCSASVAFSGGDLAGTAVG